MLKFSSCSGVYDYDCTSGPFKLFYGAKSIKQTDAIQTKREKPVSISNRKTKEEPIKETKNVEIISVNEAKTSSVEAKTPSPAKLPSDGPSNTFSTPNSKSKRSHATGSDIDGIKRTKLSDIFDSSFSSSNSTPDDRSHSRRPCISIKGASSNINQHNNSNSTNMPLSSTDDDDAKSVTTTCSDASTSSGRKRGRGRSHKSRVFTCEVCGQTGFTSHSTYKYHIEIHQGLRPFLCPHAHCGLAYENELQLLEHVSIKHSKEPVFNCTKCGMNYKKHHAFLAHKCTATGNN